jgi:hypothetical protein
MTTRPPDVLSKVPAFLLTSVEGFSDSPEYQRLEPDARQVPGLVVGQLGIWLRSLQSEALKDPTDTRVARRLQLTYHALEVLARSEVKEIQNAVVVEVLEHLHGSSELVCAITAGFLAETRRLYREWVRMDP